MIEINEIKSVIKFKEKLVSELPYVPNDKEAKEYLLSMDIGDIVHIYDFWQQRLIDKQPREVIVSSKVRNSPLYIRNRGKINTILDRVRRGISVHGYLSSLAHNVAFDVGKFKEDRSFNFFRDKILICEGFHHLHLEELPLRTDELLIVYVAPTKFEVVQVAKHSLFENNFAALVEFNRHAEDFLYSKNPEGGIFIGGAGGGMQNLAGSSIYSTLKQVDARVILQNVEVANKGIENYVKLLYLHFHNRHVEYIKPEWQIANREILIYDKKNKIKFERGMLQYRFYHLDGTKNDFLL